MDDARRPGPYSIDEARERLPELVARAVAGETVLIADAEGAPVTIRPFRKRAGGGKPAGVETGRPVRRAATDRRPCGLTAEDMARFLAVAATMPSSTTDAGEFVRAMRVDERY
jgi:antitoxin (DNA-binding transcriptional repressor) of toxin-antitoxin stability system